MPEEWNDMGSSITSRLGYGLVDADSHYYEPYDCFTRHIEKQYEDRVVHHVMHDDGLCRTYIGDKPFAWRPIFKEHVYVAPFWEDNGTAFARVLGVDHVLMGSDFPHAEGEDEPINFVNSLEGLGEDDVRRVMWENTAALIGLYR